MRNQYLALFPFVRKYISLVNVFFFNAISRAQKKKEKVKHHTKAFFSFVSKVLVIFFFFFTQNIRVNTVLERLRTG